MSRIFSTCVFSISMTLDDFHNSDYTKGFGASVDSPTFLLTCSPLLPGPF